MPRKDRTTMNGTMLWAKKSEAIDWAINAAVHTCGAGNNACAVVAESIQSLKMENGYCDICVSCGRNGYEVICDALQTVKVKKPTKTFSVVVIRYTKEDEPGSVATPSLLDDKAMAALKDLGLETVVYVFPFEKGGYPTERYLIESL